MTAVAALQATLDRIARLNEDYRPYARLDGDGAMRAAAAADAARREGRWLGLLHGMLVAVKDNIDPAGVRTSCGSALFADRVPAADAPVVERLRRAGAVVVGKAALMELCFGVRSTDMIAGQLRNPWNRLHVPGGSSGGGGHRRPGGGLSGRRRRRDVAPHPRRRAGRGCKRTTPVRYAARGGNVR